MYSVASSLAAAIYNCNIFGPCFARNYFKSLRNYVTSLGAYFYKREDAFRNWRRRHSSFIVSRCEQSKNRNLNTRFTSGKDTRIVSKIKPYFQFGLVQGHYGIRS